MFLQKSSEIDDCYNADTEDENETEKEESEDEKKKIQKNIFTSASSSGLGISLNQPIKPMLCKFLIIITLLEL